MEITAVSSLVFEKKKNHVFAFFPQAESYKWSGKSLGHRMKPLLLTEAAA